MAEVQLERYTTRRHLVELLRQAHQLGGLATRNEQLLTESSYPGVVTNYGESLLLAMRSVDHLATLDPLRYHPFIVHHAGHAIGTATIIHDQTIVFPKADISMTRGADLDYWLDDITATRRPSLHQAVARALLQVCAEQTMDRGNPEEYMALATIPVPLERIAPVGFDTYMQAIGAPTVIDTPGKDEYGIARGGRQVQVYAHSLVTY